MASRKGSPNKLGAEAKENIIAVFTRLGGTAAMAKWAQANETEFYRIYSKLIPLTHQGPDGGPVEIAWPLSKNARLDQ